MRRPGNTDEITLHDVKQATSINILWHSRGIFIDVACEVLLPATPSRAHFQLGICTTCCSLTGFRMEGTAISKFILIQLVYYIFLDFHLIFIRCINGVPPLPKRTITVLNCKISLDYPYNIRRFPPFRNPIVLDTLIFGEISSSICRSKQHSASSVLRPSTTSKAAHFRRRPVNFDRFTCYAFL